MEINKIAGIVLSENPKVKRDIPLSKHLMYTYLNAEELFLIQSFSHKSQKAFMKELSASIPLIQDKELLDMCQNLLSKISGMTEEEFAFYDIPTECEVDF